MRQLTLFRGLFLANFAITLGFGIADAFFSVYLLSLGARGILLVLPLVLYSLSKILFGPLMGALADHFGPRRITLQSLTLYLLVSVCYLFCHSVILIAVLRLIQGLCCAMFRPVLASLVGSAASGERRATSLGTFDISFYSALSAGPVLGGVLKDLWGFQGIFTALTVLCLLALVAGWACIPEGAPTGGTQERGSAGQRVEFSLPRSATLCGLLAFVFGRACGISLMGSFLPIVLSSKLGLTGVQSGMVMASGTVAMTLMLRPAGMLSDRAPRTHLIMTGGVIVSLLYFLIPVVLGFCQVLLLGVGIGLFSVLSQPASTALLVEEGARHGMGVTFGTCQAVLNLGFVLGPMLGLGVQGIFGLDSVFPAAGMVGLAAVAAFAMGKRSPKEDVSTEVAEGSLAERATT